MATVVNRKIEIQKPASRRFVSEKQLSAVIPVTTRTLQDHRLMGRGLPFYRFGRRVFYDLDECLSIVESGRCGG